MDLTVLARGAEAVLYVGRWHCVDAVYKYRAPKPYRARDIDDHIRYRRTLAEVEAMLRAHRAGVDVPRVFFFDPHVGLIVMEYLRGKLLRDLLAEGGGTAELARFVRLIGVLHKAGVAHGDPTPANAMVLGEKVYVIDFGLAEVVPGKSRRAVELMAMDINVLLRSLESLYGAGPQADIVADNYVEVLGDLGRRVLRRALELRAYGRYAGRGKGAA